MDPISLIVTALAAGAAAALKDTAETAVKDAYQGLRTLMRDRYQRVSTTVETLEAQPESAARREVVSEELAQSDAIADEEVIARAKDVLLAVEQRAPEAADEVAIDLERIRVGANVNIRDVVAEGRAIRIRDAEIANDLTIEQIRGGRRSDPGS
jgi:hypothetical protein